MTSYLLGEFYGSILIKMIDNSLLKVVLFHLLFLNEISKNYFL